ncbi:MAG: glycosyltransferase family 2 protein [Sulfobacillus sp.]
MKIGIVTVTYNSRSVLEDFFASLEKQTYADHALYIVDSGSTDDTVAYVRAHLPERGRFLQNSENIGFAAGTNQGIRAAFQDGCTAILALNNDVVFGPELLERLAGALGQYRCDMTTPMMYYYEPKDRIWAAGGSLQPWLGYRNKHRGEGETDHGQYNVACRVTFAPLCCVLIRKEVFDRVGLLDERYFTYTEDVDFMYRCLKQGISLWYVPKAKLWHKVSTLTGGDTSSFALRYQTRNAIYFQRKHLPRWLALYWYSYTQTRSFLAYLFGHNTRSKWDLRRTAAKDGREIAIHRSKTHGPPASIGN